MNPPVADVAESGRATAAVEWVRGFRARVQQRRVPLSAMLELTSRCNLRCVHCYLGSQDEQHAQRAREQSTAAVCDTIDQLAEAGCLFLLLTGGDPMMRRDFDAVYRHARARGLLVTVYCDGILVTDRIVDLFRAFPPRRVEISLYGATAETYERVTRVPGSFAHALRGIRRLLDAGIRVGLKTVLLTVNEHELEAMEAIARDLGVPFRFDAAVFPCLSGEDRTPVDYRVDAATVVRHELATPERRAAWLERFERGRALPEPDRLYTCSAGGTSCYVDPFGRLSPCVMTSHLRFERAGRSLSDIWNGEIAAMREQRADRGASCSRGEARGACTSCPAFNRLETGDEQRESEYMRALTAIRLRALRALAGTPSAGEKAV